MMHKIKRVSGYFLMCTWIRAPARVAHYFKLKFICNLVFCHWPRICIWTRHLWNFESKNSRWKQIINYKLIFFRFKIFHSNNQRTVEQEDDFIEVLNYIECFTTPVDLIITYEKTCQVKWVLHCTVGVSHVHWTF